MAPDGIEAIGHRVVHGGPDFAEPTLIDNRVIDAVQSMRYLAPLHNDPSLKAIYAARGTLNAALPMVGVSHWHARAFLKLCHPLRKLKGNSSIHNTYSETLC